MPLNDPVPSTAADVLERNAQDFDRFVVGFANTFVTRLGVEKPTVTGIINKIESDGAAAINALRVVNAGSFEDGATLTARNEVLYYLAEQTYYRWDGALPKTVAASSTPSSTGGIGAGAWVSVGDAALRSEIAQPESSVMVGGITAKRIGDNLSELGVRNAKFRDKYSGKVNLCAHRGREYAPENTVQAINALPPECNIIEFDVRLTSDGVPVCIHDATVDRTTDGSGPVAGFTFAQIRELDAGSWYADDYAGIKIPTLMEYIEAAKRKGIEVLLMQDYSTPNATNAAIIYAVLKDMNALDMVVYMASSNEQITVIRDNCPDVLLGAFSATATGRFDLLRANNGILALTPPGDSNVIAFKDFYKTAKEAGMVTGASTTDDPSNVERGYEEFGCDLILTNFVSTYTKYRG